MHHAGILQALAKGVSLAATAPPRTFSRSSADSLLTWTIVDRSDNFPHFFHRQLLLGVLDNLT